MTRRRVATSKSTSGKTARFPRHRPHHGEARVQARAVKGARGALEALGDLGDRVAPRAKEVVEVLAVLVVRAVRLDLAAQRVELARAGQ